MENTSGFKAVTFPDRSIPWSASTTSPNPLRILSISWRANIISTFKETLVYHHKVHSVEILKLTFFISVSFPFSNMTCMICPHLRDSFRWLVNSLIGCNWTTADGLSPEPSVGPLPLSWAQRLHTLQHEPLEDVLRSIKNMAGAEEKGEKAIFPAFIFQECISRIAASNGGEYFFIGWLRLDRSGPTARLI